MPDIIQFKRGHLSTFNAMATANYASTTGVYDSGSFYFVEETNRLYLAKTKKDLVDLNQYVHVVESTNDLWSIANPQDGDMYYVRGENILAYYDSSSQSSGTYNWVQMNPDTSLAVTGNASVSNSTSLFSMTEQTPVATTASGVDISQTIRDTKDHAFTSAFSIVSGNSNIRISTTGTNTIVLTPADQSANTTYDLSVSSNSSNGALHLLGNDSSTATVEFVGADDVTVASEVINNVPTITIGGARNVGSLAHSFTENGLSTVIYDSQGLTLATASQAMNIQYGATSSGVISPSVLGLSGATFNSSGIAALDVYTTAQVDSLIESKLQTANAMSYKGVVSAASAGSLLFTASTAVSGKYQGDMGDTYKVSEDFRYPADTSQPALIEVKAGDLVVAGDAANGDTDGAVTWIVIPSGDEPVLQFNNNAVGDPSVTVYDGNSNIGGISFKSDSRTGVSTIGYSATANGNTHMLEIEMRHGNAGTGTAIAAASTITQSHDMLPTVTSTFVTGISLDEHGHVTTATVANVSFTDTHTTLAKPIQSVATATGGVDFTSSLSLGDNGVDGTGVVELTMLSDNLTITPISTTDSGAATSVNGNNTLKPTVKINMEWGSF